MVEGPEIRKGSNGEDGYSGFTMRDPETATEVPTSLDDLLKNRNVERLVITGLATDYCVKSTALDGLRLGYEVRVLTEAVRAVDLHEGDGKKALRSIEISGGTVE